LTAYLPWSNEKAFPLRRITFDREHYFLSNFSEETKPTLEHLYQAEKTYDVNLKNKILAAPSAKEAKRLGRATKILIKDWDAIKVEKMKELLEWKFPSNMYSENSGLSVKLLATGFSYLEERNWWCDRFWGTCDASCPNKCKEPHKPGQGANQLGILLMARRAELQINGFK
jgi:ribA/ribD-fused uncharacterized protein